MKGSPRTTRDESPVLNNNNPNLTQAGHTRLRISVACETCRKKKLKCDALKPACSICTRRKVPCHYAAAGRRRRDPTVIASPGSGSDQLSLPDPSHGPTSARRDQESMRNLTSFRDDQNNDTQQSSPFAFGGRSDAGETTSGQAEDSSAVRRRPESLLNVESQPLRTPVGQELLPYIDSLLENVHPISCNNFLHPGSLCEALHRAPHLLVLAICGSSAKFMPGSNSKSDGQRWVNEAKDLIMKSLDRVSTLTMSAIQFLALHEMHEAQYTSAWNLIGKRRHLCVPK